MKYKTIVNLINMGYKNDYYFNEYIFLNNY